MVVCGRFIGRKWWIEGVALIWERWFVLTSMIFIIVTKLTHSRASVSMVLTFRTYSPIHHYLSLSLRHRLSHGYGQANSMQSLTSTFHFRRLLTMEKSI